MERDMYCTNCTCFEGKDDDGGFCLEYNCKRILGDMCIDPDDWINEAKVEGE